MTDDSPRQFDADETKRIAYHVGIHADHPAIPTFLEAASKLDLDPFSGEIWLLKGRREASNGEWEDFYRPAIGRDGYLKTARSKPNWGGIRSNVVCANDTFQWTDTGDEIVLLHSSKLTTEEGEDGGGNPSLYRGPVIGAWAKVFFKDETPPFFFYAPMHEYAKTEEKVVDGAEEPVRVWAGSWDYQSAMILKAAQSYVCRIGHGINGGVPVDELVGGTPPETQGGVQRDERIDNSTEKANDAVIDQLDKVTPETREALRTAIHAINAIVPFSWSGSKVHIQLHGASQETAEDVLAEVTRALEVARKKALQVVRADEVKPGQMIVPVGAEDPEPFAVGGVHHEEGKVRVECAGGAIELEPGDKVEIHAVPNPAEDEAEHKTEAEET